jgi:hypothetical protein
MLEIHGLTCGGGGSLSAERALLRLKGVRRAYVNPAMEMAYIEYDPIMLEPSDLVRAIEAIGLHANQASGH